MAFIDAAYGESNATTVDETAQLPEAPEQIFTGWTSMVPMVLVFFVFYFLLIRPQEKKRKSQEELVSGVKRGEEIMTSGGIFGTVTKINDSDNIIEVQIAKDINIKILKSAIVDIVSRQKPTNQGKIIDKNQENTKR